MKKCFVKRYRRNWFMAKKYFCDRTDVYLDTFDDLLNIRLEAFKNIRKGMSREYQSFVIDTANERLNRIRINETPLRAAIFARSSYSAP